MTLSPSPRIQNDVANYYGTQGGASKLLRIGHVLKSVQERRLISGFQVRVGSPSLFDNLQFPADHFGVT